MSTIFIPSKTVARLLQMSIDNFLRRRPDLEQDHGFPVPMPHSSRPMLFRRDQVERWIRDHGRPRDIEDRIDPSLIESGRVRVLAEARRA